MSELVAVHFWCCEYCNHKCYSICDMLEHLYKEHGIEIYMTDANTGLLGDNLITSSFVVPDKLKTVSNTGER